MFRFLECYLRYEQLQLGDLLHIHATTLVPSLRQHFRFVPIELNVSQHSFRLIKEFNVASHTGKMHFI